MMTNSIQNSGLTPRGLLLLGAAFTALLLFLCGVWITTFAIPFSPKASIIALLLANIPTFAGIFTLLLITVKVLQSSGWFTYNEKDMFRYDTAGKLVKWSGTMIVVTLVLIVVAVNALKSVLIGHEDAFHNAALFARAFISLIFFALSTVFAFFTLTTSSMLRVLSRGQLA